MLKRILSLLLILSVAAALFAGCAGEENDLSYALTGTRNGKTEKYPVGPYNYYIHWWCDSMYTNYNSMAQQSGQTLDWNALLQDTTMTAPQTFGEYLTSMAKEYYLTWLYTECLCEELGLELTDAEKAEVEQVVQKNWVTVYGNDGFNTLRKELSVTYDEFCDILSGSRKSAKIVEYYYGPGGAYEITEQEKKDYFAGNYVRFKYVVMMLQDSDGNELSEDAIGQVEANRDHILSELDKGTAMEDLIVQYSGDYLKDLSSYSDAEKVRAEAQNKVILEDGLITDADGVFDKNLADAYDVTLDEAIVNKVFSLKDGEYAAVTINDSIWIVKRYPNTEKESYFTSVSDRVYQALYEDDWKAKYTAWLNGLDYSFNEAVLEAYRPENLKVIFKFDFNSGAGNG